MSGSMLTLQELAFFAGIGIALRFKLTVPGIAQHNLGIVHCLACYFISTNKLYINLYKLSKQTVLKYFNFVYMKDSIKSKLDFFLFINKQELHHINKQLAVKISVDEIRGQYQWTRLEDNLITWHSPKKSSMENLSLSQTWITMLGCRCWTVSSKLQKCS